MGKKKKKIVKPKMRQQITENKAERKIPRKKLEMQLCTRVFGKKFSSVGMLSLVPFYKDRLFTIPMLMTKKECTHAIQFGEQYGFEQAIQMGGRGYASRDNGRIALDHEELAAVLWKRLEPLVPAVFEGKKAIGVYNKIKFYRYTKGQHFGKHVDESVIIDETLGRRTAFTFLVYLSDNESHGLVGGETIFYKDYGGGKILAAVQPEMGTGLLHGHGKRCMTHEGAPVLHGVKYLLRSDIVYE